MQTILTVGANDNTILAAVLGALISGVFVALGAVLTLWITLRAQANTENRRRRQELANIRLALHTEIGLIAGQCLLEFKDWSTATRRPGGQKKAQTALLPPLRVYEAMASNFGRLSRNEIVALVGFASTISDISVVARSMSADDMAHPNLPYSPETMLHLFSNACGKAAECLSAITVPSAEQDRRLIEELDRAHKAREKERRQAAAEHGLAQMTPER